MWTGKSAERIIRIEGSRRTLPVYLRIVTSHMNKKHAERIIYKDDSRRIQPEYVSPPWNCYFTTKETPLAGSSSYLHTTSFCLLPFKTHPMKSPTTFPSQGKNITPNKRVGLAQNFFIRNCRLVQVNIWLKFWLFFYPEKRDSSERRDEGKDQSRVGWESHWKSIGCVVGVRWRIGGDGKGSGLGSRVSLSARVVMGDELRGEWKK